MRVVTWSDLGKGCTCAPTPPLEEQMRDLFCKAAWRKMCPACSAVMDCLEADEPTREQNERALRLTGQLVGESPDEPSA